MISTYVVSLRLEMTQKIDLNEIFAGMYFYVTKRFVATEQCHDVFCKLNANNMSSMFINLTSFP